ncbi:L-asparaginase 1 [Apiospora phragmitis]|uniref:asparaginase n=1 Tax=Apiospora phragmitis TaxID=2905665 RepID=A0ABR1TWS3_9PEZI
MMSIKLLLSVGASLALASPVPAPPSPVLIGRETGHFNASRPNITIFATGGTIAGSAGSSDQTTGYEAGALGVEVLIDAVPQLWNVSNPSGIQFANVGSSEITPEILLNLTQMVQRELDKPECQGVVVTHGTDTLEETAFFLDITLRTDKPVVVVGAMRPATAISADGPINLLEAVTVAAAPAAARRGVMVVLNDRIASAYYTTKTQANAPDTFKSYEQGFLGYLLDIKPVFYFQPALPVGRPYFNVTAAAAEALPQVDILYGYQGLDPKMAEAAVANGAKGLVCTGMGAGSWTRPGQKALAQLAKENGTAVVFSRRTMDGFVESGSVGYGGGFLNPQKARYTLMLALNAGYDDEKMHALFESQSPS